MELLVDTIQKSVAGCREFGGLLLVRQLYRLQVTVFFQPPAAGLADTQADPEPSRFRAPE